MTTQAKANTDVLLWLLRAWTDAAIIESNHGSGDGGALLPLTAYMVCQRSPIDVGLDMNPATIMTPHRDRMIPMHSACHHEKVSIQVVLCLFLDNWKYLPIYYSVLQCASWEINASVLRLIPRFPSMPARLLGRKARQAAECERIEYSSGATSNLPGSVPNTDYKKIPILRASGRQIKDSEIILKHLLPMILNIPTENPDELEMERRINEELAVSLKLRNSHTDWG